MIVLVAGTGTDIGKTWVTAATAALLTARGEAVIAWKPVQSFNAGDERTDAHVLADATGASPDVVCPPHRWLPLPMAPPIAVDALGLPLFTIEDLLTETPAHDGRMLFVESVGGVRSPLTADGDTVDFARALTPACVVLVGDAGLGTINAVRLSVEVLAPHRTIVFLNRFDSKDDLHRRNLDWLCTREGLDVVTDVEALAQRLVSLGSGSPG